MGAAKRRLAVAPSEAYSSFAKPAFALLLAAFVLLLPQGPILGQPHADVSGLRLAIAARLGLIPDVARHKWNTGTAIADPVREKRLIEASLVKGREAGIPDQVTRAAIEAQIAASQQMQEELIASWREAGQGTFEAVPDFLKDTRPRIEEATDRLIKELGEAQDLLNTCAAATALRQPPVGEGLSGAVWTTAVEGLIQSAGGPAPEACPPQ